MMSNKRHMKSNEMNRSVTKHRDSSAFNRYFIKSGIASFVVWAHVVVLSLAPWRARAQVVLDQSPLSGRKYLTRESTKVDQTLGGETVGFRVKTDEVANIIESIGQHGADGTVPITFTIDSIKWRMSIPVVGGRVDEGLEISVDSQAQKTHCNKPEYSYLADAYNALKGWTYSINADKQHTIKVIEGINRNFAIRLGLPIEAIALLRSRFNDVQIRREYERSRLGLPTGQVRVGDTWDRSEWIDPLVTDVPINLKRRYVYKGEIEKQGRRLDLITLSVMDAKAGVDTEEPGSRKLISKSLKIESSEGRILFDREQNRIVSRWEKTRFSGSLTEIRKDRNTPLFIDVAFECSTTTSLH
jgi:hypothetical protein